MTALAGGDGPGLLAASDAFQVLGADLLAAEAAADAVTAWRRDGQNQKAAAAEWRVELLLKACENPVTPALAAMDARAKHTPAQREIAILAAGGLLNADIADQLKISTRTVENHLHQVCRKLGLRRPELAVRFRA